MATLKLSGVKQLLISMLVRGDICMVVYSHWSKL